MGLDIFQLATGNHGKILEAGIDLLSHWILQPSVEAGSERGGPGAGKVATKI